MRWKLRLHMRVKKGIAPVILGNAIEGEARDVALVMAGITKQVLEYGQPAETPCVLLSGGETTVTIKGNGKGGSEQRISFVLYDGDARSVARARNVVRHRRKRWNRK